MLERVYKQEVYAVSNRPLKRKKVVPEITEEDFEVEFVRRETTVKDWFIRIAVGILVVAFLMTSGLVCVLPDKPKPKENPQQQQQVDENEEMIQRYSKELASKPRDAAVLANLGYYTSLKASNMFPTDEEAKNKRMTLLVTGEEYLRKSLAEDPDYGFAKSELARNLLLQDKIEEAKGFIDSALAGVEANLEDVDEQVVSKAKSQKAELLRLSAAVDFNEGRKEEAIEKLGQVIELKPGDYRTYMQRGQLYQQAGDKDLARKDYEILVDIGQKTQNRDAAMSGQMLLQQLDAPAAGEATPAPSSTP